MTRKARTFILRHFSIYSVVSAFTIVFQSYIRAFFSFTSSLMRCSMSFFLISFPATYKDEGLLRNTAMFFEVSTKSLK